MSVKVVVLGGSGVATPALAQALHQSPDRTQPIELVLVGRSAGKLETVAGIARLFGEGDPLLTVSTSTDVDAALAGADYVLNQVRVGGLEARSFDESFPNELGMPGEETVGAGGFANASRTIPAVLDYARRMERICPEALMVSFANPSSLVQYAVAHYTTLNVLGLCDAPISLVQNIARAIGAPAQELEVDYVGMHHFGWVSGVRQGGRDRMPDVLEQAAVASPNVDAALTRALGVIPGNYLNYIFHGDRVLAGKRGKPTRAQELLGLQDEVLVEYEASLASGQKPAGLARRKAAWYDAIIAPVLLAFIEGRAGVSAAYKSRAFILNVTNQGRVPWLPDDAIVELPSRIEVGKIVTPPAAALPDDVRNLVQRNCAYEQMAVTAIVERDRERALRALLLNPMVRGYDQAVAILERAWSWTPETSASVGATGGQGGAAR